MAVRFVAAFHGLNVGQSRQPRHTPGTILNELGKHRDSAENRLVIGAPVGDRGVKVQIPGVARHV
jgi:hypothetical protein